MYQQNTSGSPARSGSFSDAGYSGGGGGGGGSSFSMSAYSSQATTKGVFVDPSHWVREKDIANCHNCHAEFSILRSVRRNRCKSCGNVFCATCAANKMPIHDQEPQRVCFPCYSATCNLTSDQSRMIDEMAKELGEKLIMRTLCLRKESGSFATLHHAIVVVTRYRMLACKRSAKRVYKSESLLDLKKIVMREPGKLEFEFVKEDGTSSVEYLETNRAKELVHTVRSQLQAITPGFPTELQVSVPDEWILPIDPPPQALPPCGGFCEVYRAYCNYYKTPCSEELVQFALDQMEESPGELDLSQCPGIEPGSSITVNLAPVFSALRYNDYYFCLNISDMNSQSLMQHISNCFKYNRALSSLIVSNVSTRYVSTLGQALVSNPENGLQEIDFSETTISDKAMRALALSFIAKKYPLRVINLRKSGMTAKGFSILMREGLLPAPALGKMVEFLDVSHNKIEEEGSVLLQSWLNTLSGESQLHTLLLSKTSANLRQIIPAIERLRKLQQLDVSHNAMEVDSCQLLSTYVSNTSTLKEIDVSGCGLSAESIGYLLQCTTSNQALHSTTVRVGGNEVGSIGADVLANALSNNTNLRVVDFSGMGLDEDAIVVLFDSLGRLGQTIDSVMLDEFFAAAVTSHVSGAHIGHALADLLQTSPNIKRLSFRGKPAAASMPASLITGTTGAGHVLPPFLERLKRNESLLELDISDNSLGNSIAVSVADMLRCNRALISLNCDGNRITLNGWQAVGVAFKHNHTLQMFSFPVQDSQACLTSLRSKKREKLFDILTSIQVHVHGNRRGGLHPRLAAIDRREHVSHLQPRDARAFSSLGGGGAYAGQAGIASAHDAGRTFGHGAAQAQAAADPLDMNAWDSLKPTTAQQERVAHYPQEQQPPQRSAAQSSGQGYGEAGPIAAASAAAAASWSNAPKMHRPDPFVEQATSGHAQGGDDVPDDWTKFPSTQDALARARAAQESSPAPAARRQEDQWGGGFGGGGGGGGGGDNGGGGGSMGGWDTGGMLTPEPAAPPQASHSPPAQTTPPPARPAAQPAPEPEQPQPQQKSSSAWDMPADPFAWPE